MHNTKFNKHIYWASFLPNNDLQYYLSEWFTLNLINIQKHFIEHFLQKFIRILNVFTYILIMVSLTLNITGSRASKRNAIVMFCRIFF